MLWPGIAKVGTRTMPELPPVSADWLTINCSTNWLNAKLTSTT